MCGCSEHYEWADNRKFTVYNSVTSKKFKKKTINFMKEKNFLPSRTNFVCNVCVHRIELLLSEPAERPADDTSCKCSRSSSTTSTTDAAIEDDNYCIIDDNQNIEEKINTLLNCSTP